MPEGAQTGQAVHAGQSEIKQNQIKMLSLLKQGTRAITVGDCHDIDIGIELSQGLNEPLPYQSMIFDNEQFDHRKK